MPDTARVFISYARKDGKIFATNLRKRLDVEEPEIALWQDRDQMQGGVGWWKQITDALGAVQFMVLVMTPAAMQSPDVRREWRHARGQGVCIFPVKAVPDSELDYASLPRWMSDAHFYNLDHEWQTFVNYLKSPCNATRVPFMAPDPPEEYVQRSREFGVLLGAILDVESENTSPGTTALYGAGGFGKTTLASALCHNEAVITAFSDGLLWATLGESPAVQADLTKLYVALTGERVDFVDAEDASYHLAEKLVDKRCLIVLDDV